MEQKKNTDTRKTVRTVTSNDFITAMGIEEMTLKARKLLYIAISQCKKNDQEFFEYQINAKDFAKLMDMDNRTHEGVTERTDKHFPLGHCSQQKRVSRVNCTVLRLPLTLFFLWLLGN